MHLLLTVYLRPSSTAKHLPKRRPSATTAKHALKKKVVEAKHSLVTTPMRSHAVGQPMQWNIDAYRHS